MMLLDSFRKYLSVMTHVAQKSVENVDRLVSVRWEFSLRAIIELTIDPKFCYYLIYSFLLTSFNQLHQQIIILPQLRLFRRVFFLLLEMPVNVNQCRTAIRVFNNRSFITTNKFFYVTETYIVGKMTLPFLAINMVVLLFFFFFMLTVSFHQKSRKNRFKSIV